MNGFQAQQLQIPALDAIQGTRKGHPFVVVQAKGTVRNAFCVTAEDALPQGERTPNRRMREKISKRSREKKRIRSREKERKRTREQEIKRERDQEIKKKEIKREREIKRKRDRKNQEIKS